MDQVFSHSICHCSNEKIVGVIQAAKKGKQSTTTTKKELDVIYFGIIFKSRLFFVCHTVGSLVRDVDPIR